MDINILKQAEINYREGVDRFIGHSDIYEKMLIDFKNDQTIEHAKDCFAKNDKEGLYQHIHSLKGASGNLSITPLYVTCCEFLKKLQECGISEASILFERIIEIFNNVCNAIAKASEVD